MIKKRIGDNLQDVFSWDVEIESLEVEELSVGTVVEIIAVIEDVSEGITGLQGSVIPDKSIAIEFRSVELRWVNIPESIRELYHKLAVFTVARSTLPLSSSLVVFHINSFHSESLFPSGAILLSATRISETNAKPDSMEKIV